MSLVSRISSLMKNRSKQEESSDNFHSVVVLLGKPQPLGEEDLRAAIDIAYGVEEQDKESDRIVQAIKPGYPYFLKIGPHMLNIINSMNPYVDDPANAAATIPELRRRKAFAEHRAWRSVDYLRGPLEAETENAYAFLAKLSAELLGSDCYGMYFPQPNEIVPFRLDLCEGLRSFTSLENLNEALDIVVPIEEDDPRLAAVVAEARSRWPEFVAAFSHKRRDDLFVVKSLFSDENGGEWMWSTVEKIESGKLFGRLSNSPNTVKNVSEDDEVVVQADGIGDWFYANDPEQVGQFSIKLLEP